MYRENASVFLTYLLLFLECTDITNLLKKAHIADQNWRSEKRMGILDMKSSQSDWRQRSGLTQLAYFFFFFGIRYFWITIATGRNPKKTTSDRTNLCQSAWFPKNGI